MAVTSTEKGAGESILTEGSMKGDDISLGDEIRGSRTVVSYGNGAKRAK